MVMMAFRDGWRALFANKKLVLLLFALNLVFALVALRPLIALLDRTAGKTLVGSRPGGLASFDYFADMVNHHSVAINVVVMTTIGILALWTLLHVAVSAGTYATLEADEGFSMSRFCERAGTYFPPFLLHLMLSVVLLVIGLFAASMLNWLINSALGDDLPQRTSFWLGATRIALVALLVWYWKRMLDYGRADIVLSGNESVLASLKRSLIFVLRRLPRALALGLMYLVPAALVVAVYFSLKASLKADGLMIVVVLFALAQLFLILRIMLKVAQFRSEIQLYNASGACAHKPLAEIGAGRQARDRAFEGSLPGIDSFTYGGARVESKNGLHMEPDERDPRDDDTTQSPGIQISRSALDEIARAVEQHRRSEDEKWPKSEDSSEDDEKTS